MQGTKRANQPASPNTRLHLRTFEVRRCDDGAALIDASFYDLKKQLLLWRFPRLRTYVVEDEAGCVTEQRDSSGLITERQIKNRLHEAWARHKIAGGSYFRKTIKNAICEEGLAYAAITLKANTQSIFFAPIGISSFTQALFFDFADQESIRKASTQISSFCDVWRSGGGESGKGHIAR